MVIPEHLRGCPAKRDLAGCVRDCEAAIYPGEVCGLVYVKSGLLPPKKDLPPRSENYRGRPKPELKPEAK